MSLQLSLDAERETALIFDSERPEDVIRFLVPEFRGKTNDQDFAIHQVLEWEPHGQRADFRLRGNPETIGLDFRGSLTIDANSIRFDAELRNTTPAPIRDGHHSFLVNTEGHAGLHDPTGERTWVYAETGWASVAQLIDPPHSRKHTIRIGASYQAITVMWKMIARVENRRNAFLAFALDRGYAFASDHPEWSAGLLGGYRWGTLQPNDLRTLRGKIYWTAGDLDAFRPEYIRDFKK